MKKLKIISALFAATIAAFVCAFAFVGCDLADEAQKNCNHTWIIQKNDSALRDATCSKEGVSAVYKCLKCQKYQYEYSPKLPHTFNGSDGFSANCKTSTVTVRQTCTVCKDLVAGIISVDCHKWVEQLHSDSSSDECERTVYKCELCRETKSVYVHKFSSISLELLQNMRDEAAAGNGCASTLMMRCEKCQRDEQYFFHDFSEEVEVLYYSSEMRITKYKCKTCDDYENRITYFNN